MATEEQRGYHDAMNQLHKALERRKHHLQEQAPHSEDKEAEMEIRISEIDHMLEIIRSLHR